MEEKKFYEKGWFIILLVFVSPILLLLNPILYVMVYFLVGVLLWKYKIFHKLIRWLIYILLFPMLVVAFVLMGTEEESDNGNETKAEIESVETKQINGGKEKFKKQEDNQKEIEAYGGQVIEVYITFKTTINNLSLLMQSPTMDNRWFANIEKQVQSISDSKKTLESLNSPKGYEGYHDFLEQSLSHYESGNKYLDAIFDGWINSEDNNEPLELALKEYTKGTASLEKFEKMTEEFEKPKQ